MTLIFLLIVVFVKSWKEENLGDLSRESKETRKEDYQNLPKEFFV